MGFMQSTLAHSAYPACSENQAVLQRVNGYVIDCIAMSLQALHRAASVNLGDKRILDKHEIVAASLSAC